MTNETLPTTSAAEKAISDLINNLVLTQRLAQWTIQGVKVPAWTTEEQARLQEHSQQLPLRTFIPLHDRIMAGDSAGALTLVEDARSTLEAFKIQLSLFAKDPAMSQLPILGVLGGMVDTLEGDIKRLGELAEKAKPVETIWDLSMLKDEDGTSIYLDNGLGEDLFLDLRSEDPSRPSDAEGSEHRQMYSIIKAGTRLTPLLHKQLGQARAIIFGLHGQGCMAAGHCLIVPIPKVELGDIDLLISKKYIIPNFDDHSAGQDPLVGDFLNGHYLIQGGLELRVRLAYTMVEGDVSNGEKYIAPVITYNSHVPDAITFSHARGGLAYSELAAVSQAFRHFMPLGLIYDRAQ